MIKKQIKLNQTILHNFCILCIFMLIVVLAISPNCFDWNLLSVKHVNVCSTFCVAYRVSYEECL